MSLPPNSEQGSGDNSSANQSTGTGHHKKVKAGIFSADALEISGGLIFLVFGGGFHIAGGWFHIAGFMCDFLVVCCGLTIITHHVETFKLFGFCYWLSLGVAFIIFASLAFYVVSKESAKPIESNSVEYDVDGNRIGLLLPANEPMPDWAKDVKISSQPTAFLNMGGNFVAMPASPEIMKGYVPFVAIRFHGKPMLTVKREASGVSISGDFFGANSNIVARLETRAYLINRACNFCG
ncbi:MAG TPA: hypothetical protein VIK53_19530 [Verrucomicrobiae bacterium]